MTLSKAAPMQTLRTVTAVMNHAILAAALFWLVTPSAAQPVPNPLAPATTMTLRADTGLILTTGTLLQQNVARRLDIYTKAGIAAPKLERLEQLHGDLFLARLNGETTRSLEARRKINDLLTSEEQAAVDAALRNTTLLLRNRLSQTTAPSAQSSSR